MSIIPNYVLNLNFSFFKKFKYAFMELSLENILQFLVFEGLSGEKQQIITGTIMIKHIHSMGVSKSGFMHFKFHRLFVHVEDKLIHVKFNVLFVFCQINTSNFYLHRK